MHVGDGRQVLHVQPRRYDRWSQSLEVTLGEWIPDEPAPLLLAKPSAKRWPSCTWPSQPAVVL